MPTPIRDAPSRLVLAFAFLTSPLMKIKSALASLCFVSFSIITSDAAVWLGSNGNYTTAGNWTPSGNPSATTVVEINAGNATYGGNLTRSANTVISGSGTLTINGTGRMVNGSGGAAAISVSGTGGINQNGEYFIVSTNNTGSVTQTGGTVQSTVSRGWFMSDAAGSSGTYTLSGGALNVSTSGSNSTNSAYAVHIGKNSGNDLLHINGGTATFTATTTDTRAYISKGAEMRIDSGSATFNNFRFFIVGRDADVGSTSDLAVNGGSLSLTGLAANGAFVVGGRNDGRVTLNDGSITVSGAAMWLGDAEASSTTTINGSFLQNGGEMTVPTGIILSRALNSTGSYVMTDGILNTSAITIGAGSNPLFDFLGGDIYLTGDQRSILGQSWFREVEDTVATYDSISDKTHIYVVPEPGSLILAAAAAGLGVLRRRRKFEA
ncbi:MAG: PEP-CTERM sorting domain-containing protein [Verrucomicrobiaceae bacterium]|nr:MAG: PEP-CTERM sorting domain-containing protein [Verrucomicrobiaceae bacterium]